MRPDALLRQIGGSYVVALAPALSALLFVAASGSATNAWLGSMGLTKQTLALDALGVDLAQLPVGAGVARGGADVSRGRRAVRARHDRRRAARVPQLRDHERRGSCSPATSSIRAPSASATRCARRSSSGSTRGASQAMSSRRAARTSPRRRGHARDDRERRRVHAVGRRVGARHRDRGRNKAELAPRSLPRTRSRFARSLTGESIPQRPAPAGRAAALAPRVEVEHQMGPLARTPAIATAAAPARTLAAHQLTGPSQGPARAAAAPPSASSLLDASIAPVVGTRIDAELRGESIFPPATPRARTPPPSRASSAHRTRRHAWQRAARLRPRLRHARVRSRRRSPLSSPRPRPRACTSHPARAEPPSTTAPSSG